MNPLEFQKNHRILVIDDNPAIHRDFRKILSPKHQAEAAELDSLEAELFEAAPEGTHVSFEIDSASQGQEGFAKVQQALRDGRPYALAFVDVRMPPGWDGIETIARLWEIDSDLQTVVCTAYSDYSWDEMIKKLGNSDRLLILKKPFDAVEVLQLANAFTEKWRLQQAARCKVDQLEEKLLERMKDLRKVNINLEHEIDQRQRASEALREKAALLDLAHDAIYVRDLDYRVQFWNKGAELLYGWTAEEAVGADSLKLLCPENRTLFAEAEKIMMEKGEWSGEVRKYTKSGAEVIVASRWTLVRDDLGRPRSVLVINTNITEKKRLEAQFLRAQRMEGIGTLASGMAHDLNNVLAPVLMAAGMLHYDLGPAERETALARIESSVKRGADIIRQVLTFGRGVNGERTRLNLGDLIHDLAGMIGETFPKNISFAEDVEEELWPITGDKTQIHQVLLNLCINARDAMPKGGALSLAAKNVVFDEPIVAAHGQLPPGRYVEVRIKDTGCGISASDMERIFDPFFTTKEVGKGTGLGLSTALGIVKSHQGALQAESRVNEGTAFKVLLPVSSDVIRQAKPVITATVPRGNGEVILIIDDELNVGSATGKMLEKHGYKTIVCASGDDALEIFRSQKESIGLVITDIMMPVMDGVTLAKTLRNIHPQIKILPSSGLGRDLGGKFNVKELETLGIGDFLAKPYTVERLLMIVRECMDAPASEIPEECGVHGSS